MDSKELIEWAKVVVPVILFLLGMEVFKQKFAPRITKKKADADMTVAVNNAIQAVMNTKDLMIIAMGNDLEKLRRDVDANGAAIADLRHDLEAWQWAVRQEPTDIAARIETRAQERRRKAAAGEM